MARGEKFNKLFFAVVNWVHDLCAAIMKEGGGEEEIGDGGEGNVGEEVC